MQKNSKKLFLLLFILAIFALPFFAPSTNAQADTAKLSARATSGSQGSAIIIPVDLSIISTTTASIVSFDLSYDSTALSFANDQFKAVVGDGIDRQANVFTMSGDSTPGGTVSVSLVEMNDPLFGVIPSGQIMKLKFNILSKARAGNTFITFSNITVIDKNNQKINTVASGNAVITIIPGPSLVNAPYSYIIFALFGVGIFFLFFFAVIIAKKHFSKLE